MKNLTLILIVIYCLSGCVNPFAPSVVEENNSGFVLEDQTTVEGFFNNWSFAYFFKDTLVYGGLLDYDFNFIFRDFDAGVDVSWSRQEDMLHTNGLFTGTSRLDLVWNSKVIEIGDSLSKSVLRGFTLEVEIPIPGSNGQIDLIRAQGRANVQLIRGKVNLPWKLVNWRDDSNF